MANKSTVSKSQKKLIGKAFGEKPKGKKGSKFHNCITSNLGRGVSYADAQKACKTSASGLANSSFLYVRPNSSK